MSERMPVIMGCLVGIIFITAIVLLLAMNMQQENAKAMAIIEQGGTVLCSDYKGNKIVNLKGTP